MSLQLADRPSSAAARLPRLLALTGELVERGLLAEDLESVVESFCARLAEAGVPLARMQISLPTVDPTAQALSVTWYPGEGISRQAHEFGGQTKEPWLSSPFRLMVEENLTAMRWRLPDPGTEARFPLLADLRQRGFTDYLARAALFGGAGPGAAMRGTIASFATDRRGGFDEDSVWLIDGAMPAFALATYRVALQQLAATVLEAYVGRTSGARVLAGLIERGAVSTLTAVLMFADLRGFTRLADSAPGQAVVRWLNEHFDAMTEPVEAQGGDILKFLGDGFLAVFEAAEDRAGACARAIAAAQAALAANAALNARRAAAGEPALDLDIALHLGAVQYGNVGAQRRLDFTVIGPAVNEAARIEALCEPLGRHLLLSADFAASCGRPVTSLGRHSLRGVAEPKQIFALGPG